jgi:hypothetical protein
VSAALWLPFALALLAFGVFQYKHLSYPLVWQDEAETVMFGQRVLDHGYPKVHDAGNVVYGLGVPLSVGVDESTDAYIGSLWGQYYYAALAVWLAEASDDPWTQTALLRLPFALAGSAGLALLLLAIVPALRSLGVRWQSAGACYLLLLCVSTSLLLHLREVRYYALGVLFVALVVLIQSMQMARLDPAAGGRRRWPMAAMQAVALFALFNSFYPAAVAAAVWLVVEALIELARGSGPSGDRARSLFVIVAPALALAAAVLPMMIVFELRMLSGVFTARWEFGFSDYVVNLGYLLQYLTRFELLAPAIAAHALLALSHWMSAGVPGASAAALRASNSLLRLCLVYALIGARNPIFFERYFVPLGPLLSIVLVLDGAALLQLASGLAGDRRRRARAALLAAAILAAIAVGAMKRDELVGHVAELSTPYRGPLDFVIPVLLADFESPAQITIATNYEAESLMYYLGSRVVGRFHAATPEATDVEQAVRVDVVIPRTQQPRKLGLLRPYLAQAEFEQRELPVADLPYNNIPELYRGRVLTTTHQFRTRSPGDAFGPLVYFLRQPRVAQDSAHE